MSEIRVLLEFISNLQSMIFNLMRNTMKIYTLINKMVGLSKNDVEEICQDKCHIKITINNLVIFL